MSTEESTGADEYIVERVDILLGNNLAILGEKVKSVVALVQNSQEYRGTSEV